MSSLFIFSGLLFLMAFLQFSFFPVGLMEEWDRRRAERERGGPGPCWHPGPKPQAGQGRWGLLVHSGPQAAMISQLKICNQGKAGSWAAICVFQALSASLCSTAC